MQRAGLTSVCFEKIHLAVRWERLEGPRILASRETSEAVAAVVKAVGPGGQRWREWKGPFQRESRQTWMQRWVMGFGW